MIYLFYSFSDVPPNTTMTQRDNSENDPPDFTSEVFTKHQILALMAENGEFYLGRVKSVKKDELEWYNTKDNKKYFLCGMEDKIDRRCVLDCNVQLTEKSYLPEAERVRLQEIRTSYLSGDESQRAHKEKKQKRSKHTKQTDKKAKKTVSSTSSSSSHCINQQQKKQKSTSSSSPLKKRKVESEFSHEIPNEEPSNASQKGMTNKIASEPELMKKQQQEEHDTLAAEAKSLTPSLGNQVSVTRDSTNEEVQASVLSSIGITKVGTEEAVKPQQGEPETGAGEQELGKREECATVHTPEKPEASSSSSSSVGITKAEKRMEAAKKLWAASQELKKPKEVKNPPMPTQPNRSARKRIVIHNLTEDNIRMLLRKGGVNQGKAGQLKNYISTQRRLLKESSPDPVPDTCGKFPTLSVDRGYITSECGTFQDILNGNGKLMDHHRQQAKKAVEEYRKKVPQPKATNSGVCQFGTTPFKIATSRYAIQADTETRASGVLARRRATLRTSTVSVLAVFAIASRQNEESVCSQSTPLFSSCVPSSAV